MRARASTLLLLFCGCATAPATSAPAQAALIMETAADSTVYTRYLAKGAAAISGQVFLTTRGGDVKLGAGRLVTADAVTPYAMDWYTQVGTDMVRFGETPPDPLFVKARRNATVDAQGNFHFSALPAGTYLLRSIVSWETGSTYGSLQGGVVADTLTIAEGETREVILNHIVSANAPIAVEALTADQVGSRRYNVIRRVSGISCKRSLLVDADPTETVAREQMTAEAVRNHASALLNVVCEKGGLSLRKNCTSFIECAGDAIRWS